MLTVRQMFIHVLKLINVVAGWRLLVGSTTIEILGKSKAGKAQVMAMRKKILEKFRYTGFDGLSNVSVTVCTLDTDTDLHESDEVDEIYRRILTFRILTHKL